MNTYWELYLLAFVVGIWLVYFLVYNWLVWRSTRRVPPPIYGPADPYRMKGPRAKQNVRV